MAKILFLVTAHNSLSQRLFTLLSTAPYNHTISVEYATSAEAMHEAAELFQPDLILCPFLTKKVPQSVYDRWMTLIVHPGAPGDAGPSALDYVIAGDNGVDADANAALEKILKSEHPSRKEWAVTVLAAIEELDAGPIWAFASFDVPQNISKSDLYRGPVSDAAVAASLKAIERLQAAAAASQTKISPSLLPPADSIFSVTTFRPFDTKTTHTRPLLLAGIRALSPKTHTASHISRLLRSGDSQPGVLSPILTPPGKTSKLFVYGGQVEENLLPEHLVSPGSIVATRDEAVLVSTVDGRGVWITHVRQPRAKADNTKLLHPKVPALQGLRAIGWADALGLGEGGNVEDWTLTTYEKKEGTLQNVWIEEERVGDHLIAYVYFAFYNGASDTQQCVQLRRAIEYASRERSAEEEKANGKLRALVLMGGHGYFSNGIHVGVIEAAADPALESWHNINAINDVVEATLSFPGGRPKPFATYPNSPELPLDDSIKQSLAERGVLTVSVIRGNCAAGGLAVATASDVVLCAERAVLNPSYRGMGLFGSEYHRYSWFQRCPTAEDYIRSMAPISAETARQAGFVDTVLHATTPKDIEITAKAHVRSLVASSTASISQFASAPWTRPTSQSVSLPPSAPLISTLLANKVARLDNLKRPLRYYRALELQNMLLDFWHPIRSQRYHSRRAAFARKAAPTSTPLRFATHRRGVKGQQLDEEEQDAFDAAPGWTPAEAWSWVNMAVPVELTETYPAEVEVEASDSETPSLIESDTSTSSPSDSFASTPLITPKDELVAAPEMKRAPSGGILYPCIYSETA